MSQSVGVTSTCAALASFESISMQVLIEEAAQWYIRLYAEDATEADHLDFERWQAQSPQHAQAYAEMVALWQSFSPAQDSAATQAITQVFNARKGRSRKRIATTLLLFIVMAASWVGVQSSLGDYILADYRTGIGQQKTIELADHTRITLNTASAVDIDYSNSQRRIVLRRGEVLVNVARDTSRPFVVETPMGTARALGTIYTVKQETEGAVISVIESNVRACTNMADQCVDLHAGQRVSIGTKSIGQVAPIHMPTATAWARKILAVDDQPLSQVLRELARYRTGHISFDEDKISHIRVSGVFPLNDTDRALSVLVATTPIRVRHFTPYWATVSPN